MAKFVLKTPVVTIHSASYSTTWVKSLTIDAGAAMVDFSAFGTNSEQFLPGLKNWAVSADIIAGNATLEATLWKMYDNGTVATLTFRAISSAVSTSNPEYTGQVYLESGPVGGAVGDAHVRSFGFKGTGDLSRVTT